MPLPVVLDVDTGVDDALALLLAALHPDLDLRAVTCVAGNAPLADVVRNTRGILARAGRADVPVAAGAAGPLIGPPTTRCRPSHGPDGLGDVALRPGAPDHAPGAEVPDALGLLRDVLLREALLRKARLGEHRLGEARLGEPRLGEVRPGSTEDAGVTVLALGPMTNLARLADAHPEALAGVRRLVAVAGAGAGHREPDPAAPADFNVRHDPEAAAAVLEACAAHGVPVTLHGLDVLREPTVDLTDAAALEALEAPAGPEGLEDDGVERAGVAEAGGGAEGGGVAEGPAWLAGRLLRFRCERAGRDRAGLGDAGAVAGVLAPAAVRTVAAAVRVQTSGPARGRLAVHPQSWPAGLVAPAGVVAPADVVAAVDGPALAALWLAAVRRGARVVPR